MAITMFSISPVNKIWYIFIKDRLQRPVLKEVAIDAGIKPVIYIGTQPLAEGFNPLLLQKPDEYTQTCSKGEWWRESEFRFSGDLDLSRFIPGDIGVIVPFHNQIRRFSDTSNFEVISLEQIGIKLKTDCRVAD